VTRVLIDPVTEASLARVWRGVKKRRERTPELRVAVRWLLTGFVVSLSLMAAAFALWPRASRSVPVVASGALLLRDGKPLAPVESPEGGAAARMALADGSQILVDPGGRLEPLASSGSELVVRLVRGDAGFDVVPGGPRRWIVEAGIARVEVVGTRFHVARTAEGVRVRVERGIVLVRSARLPDGVARVEAGQEVDVRAALVIGSSAVPAQSPLPPPSSSALRVSGPGWREEAARGRHAEAYALLGESGIEREAKLAASSEDLFTLADVARLSGHPERARAPLERVLDVYPRDSRAALAAATLGRIELDLGQPSRAAHAFERALVIGPPLALEEDLRARLVESWARAGNPAAARATGEDYRRRFPNGRHLVDIERWLKGQPETSPAAP